MRHIIVTFSIAYNFYDIYNFADRPEVGEDQVLESLKRLVSGVLTHPVTIGKLISDHTVRRKKNSPKSVHLVGTDKPEATMIYAGFYHEILAANPLNPIKLVRFMCPCAELIFKPRLFFALKLRIL